jgi:hypothetical protein
MVIFKSFAMSPQLAQISWTQAFHLPQPPKHLGLDTHYHTQLALQLLKKEKNDRHRNKQSLLQSPAALPFSILILQF